MSRLIRIALLAAFASAICPTAHAQPVVVAGKRVTTVWDNAPFGVNQFNAPDVAVLTATLPKGKKKHIVLVNAMANAPTLGGACEISYSLSLNGMGASGYGDARNTACGAGVGFCTVAGSFSFDLDAMDPASVIGQPLEVRMLINRRAGDACEHSTASLVVQLLKK